MCRWLAIALLLAMGCEPEQAEATKQRASEALKRAEVGARQGASKASKALQKADTAARDGYANAKARVRSIDWVKAFDDTKNSIDIAAAGIRHEPNTAKDPGPADAWWNRGAEAVSCVDQTCTIASWFVAAARSNPTRLMGDVKVLTAADESGWLVDAVRPGSAASAMGFRAGDTIRTVAGHRLTDAMARLEVLATLREATEAEIVFAREGQNKVSSLTVRFEATSTSAP